MPALPLSGDMLNAAPVIPSLAGELNSLGRSQPSTGQVASAFISDVFQGNGSLQQDIQRSDFNNALDTENAISPEDWKQSDNYRPGLSYYPGMTDKAAAILAQSEDDRKNREYVMGKASGLQTIAGFGSALGAGIFEPKNLASGVAAGLVTEGLGEVVPAFKRVIAIGGEIGKYKALAIRGATEGALATALTEPSNRESAKIMQSDYTMADSLLNFTMSTVLGGAIHAGLAKFKDVRAAKLPSETPEVKVKEFDAALGQMAEGRQVDVEHVNEIDKAQAALRAQSDLPKINEEIAAKQAEVGITKDVYPSIRPSLDETSTGYAKDLLGESGAAYDILDKEGKAIGGIISKETDNVTQVKRAIIDENLQGKGYVTKAYEELAQKTIISGKELQSDIDVSASAIKVYDSLERKGYTVIKNPEAILGKDGGLSSPDTKPVFRVTEVPPLSDAEKLQVKKTQLESDAKLTADKEPIARAVSDGTKPDNSTAYNPKDVNSVHDYLDQFGREEDQAALEKSLESIQEDIQSMKEEGLLSGEQLSMLDELNKIDGDINLNESVLRSAFLCLTRG